MKLSFNSYKILAVLLIIAFFSLSTYPVNAYLIKGSEVQLDSTSFSKNLSPSDNTAQKAYETIDQLTVSGSPGPQGIPGIPGEDGAAGPQGPPGPTGSSPFESNVDGAIYYNSGNLGIGTVTPRGTLDVVGTVWGDATNMTGVLHSYTETDPKVGSLGQGKIPKWLGDTLVDSVIYSNGTNVGVGTTAPVYKLDVNGGINSTGIYVNGSPFTSGVGISGTPSAGQVAEWTDASTIKGSSDYAKTAISVTQDELNAKITASELIPNQWYLITDYRTVSLIRGTIDQVYTGSVEQIYVLAADVDRIFSKGFSSTYPLEEITYLSQVYCPTINIQISYWVESGVPVNQAPSDIAVVSNTASSITFNYTHAHLANDSAAAFYAYDPDNAVDIAFDYSTEGTDWTLIDGVFTILNPGDFDFTNALNNTDGYVYIDFTEDVAPGYPKGMITSRRNYAADFYADIDYRGTKVRRWKADVSAWSAGAYTAGQVVSYNNAIWGCTEDTSTTPGLTGIYWTKLMNQGTFDYPLAGAMSFGVNTGAFFVVNPDLTSYFDYSPFNANSYSGGTKTSASYRGKWDTFNIYVPYISTSNVDAFLSSGSATTINVISETKINLAGVNYINSITNSPAVSLNNSCAFTIDMSSISMTSSSVYEMTTSKIGNMIYSQTANGGQHNDIDTMYNVKANYAFAYNKILQATNVNFKNDTQYNKFQNVVSTDFLGTCLNNTMDYVNNSEFQQNVSYTDWDSVNGQTITSVLFHYIIRPNTPTSATGLLSGTIWRDASDSNRLKMIP